MSRGQVINRNLTTQGFCALTRNRSGDTVSTLSSMRRTHADLKCRPVTAGGQRKRRVAIEDPTLRPARYDVVAISGNRHPATGSGCVTTGSDAGETGQAPDALSRGIVIVTRMGEEWARSTPFLTAKSADLGDSWPQQNYDGWRATFLR